MKSIGISRRTMRFFIMFTFVWSFFGMQFFLTTQTTGYDMSKMEDDGPRVSLDKDETRTLLTLSELTRTPRTRIECPEPLVPLYDRIIDHNNSSQQQRIPKIIHMAWIRKNFNELTFSSRCISRDLMEIPQIWMKQFPSYSFYFHDDYSVETLLNQFHPEFPHLRKLLKACVLYGTAMKIDIWRQLFMYYYGGFYSDMDEVPLLDETAVHPEDTFWSLSDDNMRPSQWLFGVEPHHPISYFALLEIIKRLTDLQDVSRVKLVQTTGPEALRLGYGRFLEGNGEPPGQIFNFGTHTSKSGMVVRKLDWRNNKIKYKDDIVEWPRGNFTHYENITKGRRIELEMNTEHWTRTIDKGSKNGNLPKESCVQRLYMMDNIKLATAAK